MQINLNNVFQKQIFFSKTIYLCTIKCAYKEGEKFIETQPLLFVSLQYESTVRKAKALGTLVSLSKAVFIKTNWRLFLVSKSHTSSHVKGILLSWPDQQTNKTLQDCVMYYALPGVRWVYDFGWTWRDSSELAGCTSAASETTALASSWSNIGTLGCWRSASQKSR